MSLFAVRMKEAVLGAQAKKIRFLAAGIVGQPFGDGGTEPSYAGVFFDGNNEFVVGEMA